MNMHLEDAFKTKDKQDFFYEAQKQVFKGCMGNLQNQPLNYVKADPKSSE